MTSVAASQPQVLLLAGGWYVLGEATDAAAARAQPRNRQRARQRTHRCPHPGQGVADVRGQRASLARFSDVKAGSGFGAQRSTRRLAGELGAACDVELGEDVREVHFHCPARDEHPFADLGVGQSLGHEIDDAKLGWGEALPTRGWDVCVRRGRGGSRSRPRPGESAAPASYAASKPALTELFAQCALESDGDPWLVVARARHARARHARGRGAEDPRGLLVAIKARGDLGQSVEGSAAGSAQAPYSR